MIANLAITKLISRFSHVNWAMADQTMVSGVNFLTGILLARFLGIEEFGRFTLIWMAAQIVASIQHAIINSPMMSIGPKQGEEEFPAYFGAIIVQQLAFSAIVSVMLFTGVYFMSRIFPEWEIDGLALPLTMATLAFLLQDFLRRYFFTREKYARAFTNDAIRYLGQLAILIGLFMSSNHPMDAGTVLWIITATAFLATVLGVLSVEKIDLNALVIKKVFRRHWNFSKWLVPSAMMQGATGNLFIISAGALLGTSAVGALKATQSLMGVVHILFLGLENIVPIRAARHFHNHGRKALFDYLKQVTLYGGGATAVVVLIAAMMPEFWLRLVFGQEYQGFGFLLQWHAVIYLLIFLSLPLRSGLRAIEEPRAIFWAYVWMVLFSGFAAYPIVHFFGVAGVMSGLTTINLILVSTLWIFLKRKTVG